MFMVIETLTGMTMISLVDSRVSVEEDSAVLGDDLAGEEVRVDLDGGGSPKSRRRTDSSSRK